MEANLKWPVVICGGIPGFEALVKPSIRVWRVEMSGLGVTRVTNMLNELSSVVYSTYLYEQRIHLVPTPARVS